LALGDWVKKANAFDETAVSRCGAVCNGDVIKRALL
jgi:hypothetical protein